jgi:hypothetical protein
MKLVPGLSESVLTRNLLVCGEFDVSSFLKVYRAYDFSFSPKSIELMNLSSLCSGFYSS